MHDFPGLAYETMGYQKESQQIVHSRQVWYLEACFVSTPRGGVGWWYSVACCGVLHSPVKPGFPVSFRKFLALRLFPLRDNDLQACGEPARFRFSFCWYEIRPGWTDNLPQITLERAIYFAFSLFCEILFSLAPKISRLLLESQPGPFSHRFAYH